MGVGCGMRWDAVEMPAPGDAGRKQFGRFFPPYDLSHGSRLAGLGLDALLCPPTINVRAASKCVQNTD